jgi:hypothetical protein
MDRFSLSPSPLRDLTRSATSPTGHLHLVGMDGSSRALKVHGADSASAGASASGVVRDVAVVGDEVVSVGYDRVVRFTEVA